MPHGLLQRCTLDAHAYILSHLWTEVCFWLPSDMLTRRHAPSDTVGSLNVLKAPGEGVSTTMLHYTISVVCGQSRFGISATWLIPLDNTKLGAVRCQDGSKRLTLWISLLFEGGIQELRMCISRSRETSSGIKYTIE
jgi:hypothetical protein